MLRRVKYAARILRGEASKASEDMAREWLDGGGGDACVATDQEPAVSLLTALLDKAREEERERAIKIVRDVVGEHPRALHRDIAGTNLKWCNRCHQIWPCWRTQQADEILRRIEEGKS